jgi:hypothetical protein
MQVETADPAPGQAMPSEITRNVPAYRARKSRYLKPAWYRRSPFISAGLLLAAVLLALGLLDMVFVARHLTQGRDHLLAGARTLQLNGTTLTTAQATQASADFREADNAFTAAHQSLTDPGFRLLSILPLLGNQVRALQALSDMGVQVSRTGEVGVQVVDTLLNEKEVGPGSEKKPPGERLLALLKALDPKLNTIDSNLQALQSDRRGVPPSGLLPPISSAIQQFDAKFASVPLAFKTFRSVEPGLYAILGTAGPRSYLVLQQDPAEIRAGGGFIGSVGFLDFDHGKMAPYQPHDVYEFDGTGATVRLGTVGGPKYVAPPAPIDRFIHPSSWELRDSNWWPDFPTSAKQAQFFYQRETGQHASGVITIDPFFVSKLLGVIGPVKVPETGDTVTADNFFLKTIERVQLHQGPGGQKSFLTYAGKPILDKLFSLPSRQWVPLMTLLAQSCENRSVQAYFDDPASEALVSHFGCDGRIHPIEGDGLLIVDTNLDGNKDDFWVTRTFKLEIDLDGAGNARHKLQLHYSGFPQLTNITGPYIGWLRVYLPPSAKLVHADGADLHLGSELGRAVAQGWVEWRFNGSKDVTIVYDVDAATMHAASGSFDLYWQKQAGRPADPISVTVQAPRNWTRAHVTLNAVSVTSSTIATDLAIDREFRFVYRRS